MKNQLQILSYNIHKGFRADNKKYVLREIRELLRGTEVDIVFLQEVIGESARLSKSINDWPGISQYEFLAEEVWLDHRYGRNSVYEGGHHGNAILSRFTIDSWENHDISTNKFERRGVLHTTIKPDKPLPAVHACCTHLNLTRRGRTTQMSKICKWLSSRIPKSEPLILAGDFNDWTKKASKEMQNELGLLEVMEVHHGKLSATFPSRLPVLSLDRIYVRGAKVTDAQILRERVWRRLSDHIPVRATLQF